MLIIKLDATGWNQLADFGNAVHAAVGAPPGYNTANITGLLEAIYWDHAYASMRRDNSNWQYKISPPFTLQVVNVSKASLQVQDDLVRIQSCLAEAHDWFRNKWNHDVDVRMEIFGRTN